MKHIVHQFRGDVRPRPDICSFKKRVCVRSCLRQSCSVSCNSTNELEAPSRARKRNKLDRPRFSWPTSRLPASSGFMFRFDQYLMETQGRTRRVSRCFLSCTYVVLYGSIDLRSTQSGAPSVNPQRNSRLSCPREKREEQRENAPLIPVQQINLGLADRVLGSGITSYFVY